MTKRLAWRLAFHTATTRNSLNDCALADHRAADPQMVAESEEDRVGRQRSCALQLLQMLSPSSLRLALHMERASAERKICFQPHVSRVVLTR